MPISDDGALVGEPDGQSFGVGVAPRSAKAEPSSVVQLKKKEEDRKRKKAGRDTRRWVDGYVGRWVGGSVAGWVGHSVDRWVGRSVGG